MALLRTKQLGFAAQPLLVGNNIVYTCPGGHRAVVRDIRFTCNTAVAGATTALWFVKSGGPSSCLLYYKVMASYETAYIAGQIVLEAGDQLVFTPPGPSFAILVSGAELELPP